MTSDTLAKKGAADQTLKYVSLVTLTGQNAVLGLSMRYARTRPGDMFISTTAVAMSELVKLFACLLLVWNDEGKSLKNWWGALDSTIIKQPIDTLKVCVPSFIYLIQNNLLYVAASNLDVATYQITYQLKILTTAVFAVTMLNKKLISTQWISLLILIGGVALVQLSDVKEQASQGPEQSKMVGFTAALTACILSGFAGVYFEKILKGSDISVWMRNVQLALLSVPLGLITTYLKDGSVISEKGFFTGYDNFVWFTVMQNALGGLLVAVVVKYADNILKGFACSLAIIITCIASIFIFDFNVTVQFALGAGLVISSIFMYGYTPKPSSSLPQKM
ncbi:UDP-N-acetylglucosamine transporter [Eurytemora carolleeae]|uniref:UDP-N-acetylglucosamine transporter n=1 Tax=Eurytemora carolleeae TaxID=1294199 RepID=UPI000C787356|nr:UDP-N-acetylglucosamine transporter [Eurytemora carolleeae]|eukprot:XP_023330704.1 UDP-N-acetylglucosamine transporter-like [Eurytemora affinis]